MIPDDVRRTIKHALVAYWDANRWRYENDSMPHVDKAMDWIDKPFSHRNGETEPPEVKGWYWYELESDDWRIVEVDNVGMDEDWLAAYYSGVETSNDVAYMRGRWYGPIPEPVQEARHDDDA